MTDLQECAPYTGVASYFARDGAGGEPPIGTSPVDFGRDVAVRYDLLETYCSERLEGLDVDLLMVAATIAQVDRSVDRGGRIIWSRRLTVSIPVHDPVRWSAPAVNQPLHEFLNYLTGDAWTIRFRRREGTELGLSQIPLFRSITSAPCSVLAYSAGLDSFAQLQLMLHERDRPPPLLITAEQDSRTHDAVVRTALRGVAGPHVVQVPVRLSPGPDPEETYRTRMMLFLSLAVVACRLTKAGEVVIAENGQGAIGPSLVTLAQEHPFRSAYPRTTWLFARFVEALWRAPAPRIRHPRVWQTKGEVLGLLASRDLLGGWRETSSCSRRMDRIKGSGTPLSCGFCGNCLLRRQSVFTAGLEPEAERYYFHDLSAPTLQDGVHDAVRPLSRLDEEIARAATMNLEFLSREASTTNPGKHRRIVHECAQALAVPADEAAVRLSRLLHRHREEWDGFLGSLDAQSLLVRTARGG